MNSFLDVFTHAEAYKDDIIIPISLCFSYPKSDSEEIKCGILFDNREDILQVFSVQGYSNYLEIRTRGMPKNIWIPKIRIDDKPSKYPQNKTYRGIAELLFLGQVDDFQEGKGEFDCYFILQDCTLVTPDAITWTSPFGPAKLIYDYPYGDYCKVLESRPSKKSLINIKVNANNHKSLKELLLQLTDYLDEVMWLISFLCKRYVHWYQLNMCYKPDNDESAPLFINGYRDASIVQWNEQETESPIFGSRFKELLIKIETLKTEVACQMFNTYHNSDHCLVIKKIIPIVMVTFSPGVIEKDLVLIYTALEVLTEEFSESFVMGTSKFDKVQKALRDYLSLSKKELKLSSEEIEQIKLKLPELKRRSFKNRLKELSDKQVGSLPKELSGTLTPESLFDRLEEVIKRRNHFIHSGKIEDYRETLSDIALIRFLVNIWILSLLNYPLKEINVEDPDLMMIARVKSKKGNDG